MADHADRLAWLAGDEITIARLRNYALELAMRAAAIEAGHAWDWPILAPDEFVDWRPWCEYASDGVPRGRPPG